MKKVGVVGLGDMGSHIVMNQFHKAFETIGFNLSVERLEALWRF